MFYNSGEQTMAQRTNLTDNLFLKIKLYWRRANLINLYITYGCFCATMAKLSSDRDQRTHKAQNIY